MPGTLLIATFVVAIYLIQLGSNLTKGTLWNGETASRRDKAVMLVIFGIAFYAWIGLFVKIFQ